MRKRLMVGALLGPYAVRGGPRSGSQAMVGGSVQDSAKKLGAAKVTTVTLNGWVGATVEDDLLKEVIAAFEKSHPNIKVNYAAIKATTRPRCWRSSPRGNRRTSSTWLRDVADWMSPGRSPAARRVRDEDEVLRRSPSTRACRQLQVQGQDVRLAEGLVVSRDAGQPGSAEGQRDPDDVGAASDRRAEDQHRGRQADLPRSGLGAHAGVRLPGGQEPGNSRTRTAPFRVAVKFYVD